MNIEGFSSQLEEYLLSSFSKTPVKVIKAALPKFFYYLIFLLLSLSFLMIFFSNLGYDNPGYETPGTSEKPFMLYFCLVISFPSFL